MELHNYQEARLKLFEDKRINEVWVYPKEGGRPFPLPASKITVETDFQTSDLESFQQKIETRAAPAFQNAGRWEEKDYDAISAWVVLHLIRNRKSRMEFFSSAEECFAKSPQILVLFSEGARPPQFEIAVEDFFNAMVYSLADQSIFSHRNDVCIQKLHKIREDFDMFPAIGE